MAPCAEECGKRSEGVPVHQSRRILPGELEPARAWVEHEHQDRLHSSPGESRRLLDTAPPDKSKVQAGLTLDVAIARSNRKIGQIHLGKTKPKVKTKFQKRKEKLYSVLRPPYFVLCMIIILISIQCVVWSHPWLVSAVEWQPGAWWRQPWRLLSYSLVHASSPRHLALNALVALVVGWCLEREQGWWRVSAVWGGGVAAGALGVASLQPLVRMVGASAGVYALLTAHLPNVCLRFGHIPLWWFRPLSVLVLCASEGAWMLLQGAARETGAAGAARGAHRSSLAAGEDGVAWSAHAAGALVGIPLGLLVFTGENKGQNYIVCCRVASAVLLTLGVIGSGVCSYYNSLHLS